MVVEIYFLVETAYLMELQTLVVEKLQFIQKALNGKI
jgi:hypothetical protein